MRPLVVETGVIQSGLYEKIFGPSSKVISSHGALKSRDSQHAYTKNFFTQTWFAYTAFTV